MHLRRRNPLLHLVFVWVVVTACYDRHTFGQYPPPDADLPNEDSSPDTADTPNTPPVDFSSLEWTEVYVSDPYVLFQDLACPTPNRCYAVGSDGVVMISTDFGAQWTPQTVAQDERYLLSIACPSATTCVAVGYDALILHTSDGGENWISQTSPTAEDLYDVSCIDQAHCLIGLLAGGDLIETRDGGQNWSPQDISGFEVLTQTLTCASDGACLLVDLNGVPLRTLNAGESWTRAPQAALPHQTVTCNGDICVTGGFTSEGKPPLAQSLDRGASWQHVPVDSTTSTFFADVHCPTTQVCIATDTFRSLDLYITVTAGADWNAVDVPALDEATEFGFDRIVCPELQFCVAVQETKLWRGVFPD